MSDPSFALIELPPASDADAARVAVREALAKTTGNAALVVPLATPHPDPEDALAWLAARSGTPRSWFCERDREHVLAGVGSFQQIDADDYGVLASLAEQDKVLPEGARVPFVVTGRFDASTEADELWEPFGCVRALRHALTWEQRDGTARLVALHRADAPCPQLTAWLEGRSAAPSDEAAARKLYRKEEPDPDGWRASVRSALQEIRDGDVEKVVLARRQIIHLDGAADAHAYARALAQGANETFRFLIAPDDDCAFLGATPELLYERRARALRTEALAGTRRRGLSDVEDERLEEELAASPKEQHEHALVGSHLTTVLESLTASPPITAGLAMRRLPTVQHLLTRIEATLKEGISDRMVVEALAPTPAVCGTPRDVALEAIGFYERFDRGLYAGIVGLASQDEVVLSVAIRSVLLSGTQAIPYAGAGIVDGSAPEDEWEETELKLLPATAWFEAPLGAEDGHAG